MSRSLRKHLNRTLAVLAVASVFGVSFVMGRRTALKSTRQLTAALDEAERTAAVLPLLKAAETEPAPLSFEDGGPDITAAAQPAPEEEEAEEEREEPPFPLPMPVAGVVGKAYSLQAVYSETMGDWRAHMGMDIEAPLASAVTAPAEGTVTAAYNDRLWGNVIEIEHSGGLKTVYKGVSTLDMVEVGGQVSAGQTISGVGQAPWRAKPPAIYTLRYGRTSSASTPKATFLGESGRTPHLH